MMTSMRYQRALIQIDTGRRTIARPRRWGVRVVVAVLSAVALTCAFWGMR